MERRPTYDELIRENARLQAEVTRLRGGEQRPEKLPPGTPDPRD